MMVHERRAFDDEERVLDLENPDQVRAWADRYQVDEDAIREACSKVGPNRTAVELLLNAPPA